MASIIIARFEMKQIDKIAFRKRRAHPEELKLVKTWNPALGKYVNCKSASLRHCIEEIYAKIFHGAVFPFEAEVYKKSECLNERPSNIRMASIDANMKSIREEGTI